MGRLEDLTARQIATMPLPEPVGTRAARVRLWAYAALQNELQMTEALAQLAVNAAMKWVTVKEPDETTDASTPLPANTGTGASDVFLDFWGRAMQGGRRSGELDADYGRRIVAEMLAPGLTNFGLAAEIDRLLGFRGTVVADSSDFFDPLRANDENIANDGLRASPISDPLWNTFVVVLPLAVGSADETSAIAALCDEKKAAGNRLYSIVTETGLPQIHAPEAVLEAMTFNAAVTRPEGGATFVWDVVGGTITAGQGTDEITVAPDAPGVITVTVAQTGGDLDGLEGTALVVAVAN